MSHLKLFSSQVGKVDNRISVSAHAGLVGLHVCLNDSCWFQYVNLSVEGGAFILASNYWRFFSDVNLGAQSPSFQTCILPKLMTEVLMVHKRWTALDGGWFYSSR